ncbi:MAG: lipoprotein-releasing ABC transporter permease subunit [Pseudomonadota bacterium]
MASQSAPFGPMERALAWRYVRARREHGGLSITAILSFAGIALAVFALIAIMSIMAGFRATLLDALLGGQPHVYGVTIDRPSGEVDPLIDRIEAVPGVTRVTPYLENQVLISNDGIAATGGLVKSITNEELTSSDFLPDQGEAALAAGFGEGRNGGDVILLGAFLAADLRVRPGDRVKLISPETNATPFGGTPRSKTYTVGDVFKTGSVELDKVYILMPLEQGQIFFQQRDRYEFLDIRIEDPMATEGVMERINEAVGGSLYVFDWKSQRAQYFNALNVERNMMRIIMFLLILITALNIITGVLMLVKNKTRDIAILRTIGASRGAMMRVFVMIGAALGFIGAVTGLSLGVLFVVNIPNIEAGLAMVGVTIFDPETYGLEGVPYRLSAFEVVGSTIWAVIVSVLVTLWPAWRGASVDPVDALRFE